MKKISLQLRPVGDELAFFPISDDDRDNARSFKINQPVIAEIKGSKKERSLKQLGVYWACCRVFAEQHDKFRDRNQVDDQLRVDLEFYDKDRCIVTSDGTVHVFYLSIAIANLEHIEACDYFTRAFDIMADGLGITVKMLIANCRVKQI